MNKTLLQTLTEQTTLSPTLEQDLKGAKQRRAKKIKDSALGLVVGAIGFLVLVLAGYLATRKDPNLTVLGGTAAVAMIFFAAGGLLADRETVWPVLRDIVGLVLRIKSGKAPEGGDA